VRQLHHFQYLKDDPHQAKVLAVIDLPEDERFAEAAKLDEQAEGDPQKRDLNRLADFIRSLNDRDIALIDRTFNPPMFVARGSMDTMKAAGL